MFMMDILQQLLSCRALPFRFTFLLLALSPSRHGHATRTCQAIVLALQLVPLPANSLSIDDNSVVTFLSSEVSGGSIDLHNSNMPTPVHGTRIMWFMGTGPNPPHSWVNETCQNWHTGIEVLPHTLEQYTENDYYLFRTTILHVFTNPVAAENPTSCQQTVVSGVPITTIDIYLTAQNRAGTYTTLHHRKTGPFTITRPTKCTSQVSNVAFGTIRPGASGNKATATVNTDCTKESTIKIVTNNRLPLVDAATGSHISFKDPGTQTCKSCRLPISVVLTQGPTSGGSYQWVVPIVVEYQ